MSDLREIQPEHQTIDARDRRRSDDTWEVDIWAPVYSGIKQEKVYAKRTTFVVTATTFSEACYAAELLSTAIGAAHDVWQTQVKRVAKQ